jgi:hypothetical protein
MDPESTSRARVAGGQYYGGWHVPGNLNISVVWDAAPFRKMPNSPGATWHTRREPMNKIIYLNPAEDCRWYSPWESLGKAWWRKLVGTSLYTVLGHELGHCLGLPHVEDDIKSIMHTRAGLNRFTKIPQRDLLAAEALATGGGNLKHPQH